VSQVTYLKLIIYFVRNSKSFATESKFGQAFVTKSLKVLPRLSADPHAKGGFSVGVNWLGWSGDGKLLAVRADNYPRCLWIWNAFEGTLCAFIVPLSAITYSAWRPTQPDRLSLKPMLAFCTGVPRVYFWTPSGVSWIDIPAVSSDDADVLLRTANDSSVGAFTGVSTDGRILVTGLKWSADGRKLILLGKGLFSVCDVLE
jgi:hypothetical protein